tara:strand:+ start:343 stop:1872 length:1530 start_codon:yes stop_codon:yes gene_type:complete
MAGYVARRRFDREETGWRQHGDHIVPSWTYTSGSLTGLEAVDPWERAGKLNDCSREWIAQARVRADGSPLALPIPQGCNQDHICPVCAARKSRELARQVRAFIADQDDPGELALVTLTHRAREDEPLADALARWRRAWDLLSKGRAGQQFRARVRGYYYGIEVTHNQGAGWWHLHCHIVLETRPRQLVRDDCGRCEAAAGDPCRSAINGSIMRGVHKGRPLVELGEHQTAEDVRDWMGQQWEKATRSASGDDGWDPVAGCWDTRPDSGDTAADARARIAAGNYSGLWWRPIDRANPKEVYQACKYPSPICDLGPVELVEFLSASHGRKWHQGGLEWRSIRRLGDQAIAEDLAEGVADGTKVDLGRPICSMAPGHAPTLDSIIEDRGLRPHVVDLDSELTAPERLELVAGSRGTPTGDDVRWVLSQDEHDTAQYWQDQGWAVAGITEIERLVPCEVDHPDAELHTLTHRSGRSVIRHIRREIRVHPTVTMAGELACALILDTEDLVRDSR